jgi:hypothetical protein
VLTKKRIFYIFIEQIINYNIMKNKREAFNFYRSYYDVLEDIHRDEDKLTYLMSLLDRQFKGIEPSLEGIPKLVYNGQRHSIDKQVEGWENKTKTKLTPTEGGSEDPYQPPTKPPYEPPTEDPSQETPMTTEGGTEPPYLQEQGKGEEKEKEEVKEKEKLIVDFTWQKKDYIQAWKYNKRTFCDGVEITSDNVDELFEITF